MVRRCAGALLCASVMVAAVACNRQELGAPATVAPTAPTTLPTVPGVPAPGVPGSIVTSTTGAAGSPSTAPATSDVAVVSKRLRAVDNGRLKMGAEFNKRFIALQLQSAGFTVAEADCVTTRLAATAGSAFAGWTFTQLATGAQGAASRDVLIGCISTDRLAALATGARTPNIANVDPAQTRSVFGELASHWFESGGLSPTEATCLADKAIGGVSDQQITALFNTRSLDEQAVAAALPACVDAARLATLAGR